jgi:hypothetical protein
VAALAIADWNDDPNAAMEPPGYGRKHLPRSRNWVTAWSWPQWSRPVMGGNTCDTAGHLMGAAPPQWSRPVMGGNTELLKDPLVIPALPQWSRPVMGGNTSSAPVTAPIPRHAAMEPPGYGRKHGRTAVRGLLCRKWPQWSRPVMGGNTLKGRRLPDGRDCRNGAARLWAETPPARSRRRPGGRSRRNGAARLWAETPVQVTLLDDVDLAAMEPPGYGRKHGKHPGPVHSRRSCRNGAARLWAETLAPVPRPVSCRKTPQWSRPVMGGNTGDDLVHEAGGYPMPFSSA